MEIRLDRRRVRAVAERSIMKILEKNNSTIIVENKGKIDVFVNNAFNRLKFENYDGEKIHLKSDDIEVEEHSTNVYTIRFGKHIIHTLPRHSTAMSKCIHSIKYGKAKGWASEHQHRLLLDVIETSVMNKQFLQFYPKAVCRGYRNMAYDTWRDAAYEINPEMPNWFDHEYPRGNLIDGRNEKGGPAIYRRHFDDD